MMSKHDNNKQIIKISVLLLGVFAIILSVTYAFINITLQGEKKQVITAGNLDLVLDEDDNNLTITDALPMYDEVGMMQDAFTFRIINNTTTDTNYILKLTDITTGDALDTNIVKYGLTKNGVGEPALLSTLPDDGTVDSGTIGNKETIEYTLRLWIDSSVTANSVISGRSLSYRVDLEVNQEIEWPVGLVANIAFRETLIGENCGLYNDGVDTFLVGQCKNNYVWYSGKLWRVVLKNNETDAVKMVTDNAMTVISYNNDENVTFKDSYVDQWINQEFLPTLHDASTYLVENSVWDITADSSSVPTRPNETATVEGPIGLLNAYEYRITYASALSTPSTGYLNNKVYWWLMTPYSDSEMRTVRNNGDPYYPVTPAAPGMGIRPAINLQSIIKIISGKGTIDNPFILEGDLQTPVNGTTLISTRNSGEYVTFNNELYRIVDKEIINGETLTKITAVDKPSELISNVFDSSTSPYVTSFAEADIKTDLETYYQNLATTNETAYNMIQPSTTWYLGQVNDGVNYKASICASVDAGASMNACTTKTTSTTASIGLPRVGEMFTSQITRETRRSFWTLTRPHNYSLVRYVADDGGYLANSNPNVGSHGARPSLYLKSAVRIASTNVGNGTYEYPYSIELAS